jgi:hypothetical protein
VRREDGGEFGDVGGDEVVGDDTAEMIEPEEGELGEDAALVWDGGAEDVIKGGDAIGRNEEKVVSGGVEVADFAAGEEREREIGLKEWRHVFSIVG